jgi:integrase
MKRTSYQNGSVVRKSRKKSPDIWVYRYKDSDGKQKAEPIGSIQKYPTKAAATKKAAKMREEINERANAITFAGLCDKYIAEALPSHPKTADTYRGFIKRLKMTWAKERVDLMAKDIMGIENWIDALETIPTEDRIGSDKKPIKGRPSRPVSKKTKIHYKAFLHRLLEYAIKWGHVNMQRNPIGLVEIKGRAKKVRRHTLLTHDQWHALISDSELVVHVRTMIFIAMLLGLRVSEILGLRWEDVDFDNRKLRIGRSQVGKHTGDTKTEGSEQELPIHDDLAVILQSWSMEQPPINGWVFGSIATGRPYWGGTLQEDHLIPAGKKIGIESLGWHDFRHTYRAMMGELKLNLEEQRALMRHEDIRTTLDYGGKTPAESLRGANAKVVEMLRKRA